MRELESLLPELVPPAGGLARLQRSIGGSASRWVRRRGRGRWAFVAVACAVVAVLAATLPRAVNRQHQSAAILAALQAGAMTATSPQIKVAGGAAIELPSGQSNVRLYLVQTAAAGR